MTQRLTFLALTLALPAALVAPAAHAQTQALPVGGLTYNASDCSSTSSDEVQFDTDGLSGSYYWSLQLTEPQAATGSDCPRYGDAEPANIVVPFGDAALAANGAFQHLANYSAEDLLGEVCDTNRRRQNFPLCIYFSQTTATPQSSLDIDATSAALTVAVDTVVPSQPSISVSPGDASLRVTLGSSPDDSLGDVYTYEVQYRACDDLGSDGGTVVASDAGTVDDDESVCNAPGPFAVQTFTSETITLSGLVVGEDYEVRLVVIDDFGNRSPVSVAVVGRPQSELGPLDLYDGEDNLLSVPGPDVESCNDSIRDGSFGLLGLGLLAVRRRRRRTQGAGKRPNKASAATLALLMLLALGLSLPAAAYPGQVTVGFKAGPYTPAIDTELVGGSRIYPIYECFFEKKNGFFPAGILPHPGIDVDVHLFDMFGSLELGMGMNFTQARGTSVPVSSIGAAELSTRTCPAAQGTESVELTIGMFKPQLTYRLDQLNDYFGIPFVPYARGGLVTAVYAFTNNGAFDNDGIASGRNPLGVRFGAEASVGMMLALDWFDARDLWDKWNYMVSAIKVRRFDWDKLAKGRKRHTSILEHSYVFAEVTTSQINTFGMPGLILSPTDKVFGTGYPWTFQIGMAAELF